MCVIFLLDNAASFSRCPMPRGVCAECGLEATGPGLFEDEAFLCCDCDIELSSYSREERFDPVVARQSRNSVLKESLLNDVKQDILPSTIFKPVKDLPCLRVFSDPQQTHFAGVGTQVWPAAAPLARYLGDFLQSGVKTSVNVVELGAGCGMLGLWLWLHSRGKCLRICLTDLPRLCPLMELNSALAQTTGEEPVLEAGMEALVRPLRWGLQEDLEVFRGEQWDLVIGSDICYSEDKVEPLLFTLSALSPAQGAIFCLSLCGLRGPGAWALEDRCKQENWQWRELAREVASDDAEVMIVHIQKRNDVAKHIGVPSGASE